MFRNVHKYFCPSERTLKILLGSGQEGTSDGTDQTCSSTQVRGICSINKTLVVSPDLAAGTVILSMRRSPPYSIPKTLEPSQMSL